jgi:hypothetical protein
MCTPILPRFCLCCGAILLVVATGALLRADAAHVDDGWRRTAQGWELLHTEMPISAVLASQRTIPDSPSILHPLLLAAVQVSLVAVGYWRFPVKR